MSTQPGDPRPTDPAPLSGDEDPRQTTTPPPGLLASSRAYLQNPSARILVAIVVVLLVVLGIVMVVAMGDTSDEPGPGAAVSPALAALRAV